MYILYFVFLVIFSFETFPPDHNDNKQIEVAYILFYCIIILESVIDTFDLRITV